jgi:hypothetical protein
MRKRLIIILLFLLLMLIPSCVPNRSDFSKRKYINHRGMHRKIPFYYQDKYRGPLIKSERKRALTKPSTINLDKW